MAETADQNLLDRPEVAPGSEADIRQAWQNRPRPPRKENIRPAPSLALDPALKAPSSGSRDASAKETPQEESPEQQRNRVSDRLYQRKLAERARRAKKYEAAGLGGQVEGRFKKLRQLKKIIRVIRVGGLAGTSLGDIFFSLGALFLSLVGEWILSKFIPGYELVSKDDPFRFLDKILWYVGWAVVIGAIILIIVLLAIVIYVKENPSEALKFFPALKNMSL